MTMTEPRRTSMTATEAIATRRSIRSFTPDPVDEAQVRALLEAAVQAPTAMHVEPWVFLVIQDRAALKRYSDVAKTTMVREADLYRDLHDPSVTPKNGGFLKALARPDFNVFYNAGTVILIACRQTSPFVVGDCWLAAENLMLEAHALGLGTCCIGSALPAFQDRAVRSELGLPEDLTVMAAIVVGVPAERPAPRGRKPPFILTWKKLAAP
ncbi:MAG: nitroreductase family protein [Vicinamibacterales bacterium]